MSLAIPLFSLGMYYFQNRMRQEEKDGRGPCGAESDHQYPVR